jgi:hypothetical protein
MSGTVLWAFICRAYVLLEIKPVRNPSFDMTVGNFSTVIFRESIIPGYFITAAQRNIIRNSVIIMGCVVNKGIGNLL